VRLQLQTAKKITELLHEETNSSALGTFTNSQSTNTPASTAIHSDPSKENAMNKCNTITSTKRKHIKKSVVQQQLPIPTIVNRYALPNIRHTTSEDSQSSGISEVKTSTKTKNNPASKPRKNKISVIGDSHAARGCASNKEELKKFNSSLLFVYLYIVF
jgi:hypothetical protein